MNRLHIVFLVLILKIHYTLCHNILPLLHSVLEDGSDVPYKQQCLGKDMNKGGIRLELMSTVNNKFTHCVLHNMVFLCFCN